MVLSPTEPYSAFIQSEEHLLNMSGQLISTPKTHQLQQYTSKGQDWTPGPAHSLFLTSEKSEVSYF